MAYGLNLRRIARSLGLAGMGTIGGYRRQVLSARFALEASGRAEADAMAGADPAVLMCAAHTLSGRRRSLAAAAATACVGRLEALGRIPRGPGASEGCSWA